METNEISMFMDAKLDIHSKRPESLKFKTWSRCLVKIEAVKCLPSFLRVTLTRCSQVDQDDAESSELQSPVIATLDVTEHPPFTVSINVPGVNVSQTESRTKPHSYGLFWRQHRRDCFIYFAIETESSFRRHMKWIKKSIKNLELHRQVFLELRRNSRGSGGFGVKAGRELDRKDENNANSATKSAAVNALGPLPKIPDANISGIWSSRVSRVSEIYEEILDQDSQQGPRLSRRYSRSSIASGIYEEMKPVPAINFNAIVEEVFIDSKPPPVPPLPPRKRINTFEAEPGLLGDVRRSSTNPEVDMAKKKKYKNMLKNSIFGGVGRSKRAASVSETAACSVNELLDDGQAVYENSEASVVDEGHRHQRTPKTRAEQQLTAQSKRNSFSSPDLSKINFIDTFDDEEQHIGVLIHNSFTNRDDLSESLDEASVQRIVGADDQSSETPTTMLPKEGSQESLNISEQIPVNFNFSACNSSTINLVGACGASLAQSAQKNNKILIEDLTGYCVMAPIPTKKQQTDIQPPTLSVTQPASTLSSGYSTGGSHYSSTSSSAASSCVNSTEHKIVTSSEGGDDPEVTTALTEESGIYEQMMFDNNSLNSSAAAAALYENILTIKAAQELAVEALPATPPTKISTSTPTGDRDGEAETEENFYQTPRRSIISVDDKVPSYFPNSCDNNKTRRIGQSPNKGSTTPTGDVSLTAAAIVAAASTVSLRQVVSSKLCHERKENLCISSPQKTMNDPSPACKSNKSKKTAAHKISEHVYNVSHAHSKKTQKSNSNTPGVNAVDAIAHAKLQRELLQLVALQNIDFKFDEPAFKQTTPTSGAAAKQQEAVEKQRNEAETEVEDENCSKIKENKLKSTKLIQKLATAPRSTPTPKSPAVSGAPTTPTEPAAASHHLQQSQQLNVQQQQPSPKGQEAFVTSNEGSVKKFASLPRFKKIDFSPLKLKISNVLQRSNHQQQQQQQQQAQQQQLS